MSQEFLMSYFVPALGKDVKLGAIINRPAYQAKLAKQNLRMYMMAGAIPLPASVDYTPKALESIKRMYKNDTYGDCVIAAKYHSHGVWTGNDSDSGGIALATDDEVVTTYHKFCGPGDLGCNLTPVLDQCRDVGIPMNGRLHKIDGYVPVDHTDVEQVKAAIYLFGAVDLATDVPSSWMNTSDGGVWDVTNWPSVGGHCIPAIGYNDKGVIISTWGGLRTITWAAFTSTRWIGEAYAMLASDWYGSDKMAPSGVDVVKLKADMDIIKGGGTPSIDPVPPTPPVPPVPPSPVIVNYNGSGTAQLTGPFGWFGSTKTVPVSLGSLQLTLSQGPAHAGAFPPINFGLIVAIAEAVVPVVIADFRAGKTTWQTVMDAVAAAIGVFIQPTPGRR